MHHEYEQQNGCNTVLPRDIVCLRNISINTLHKADDDDDDDDDNNSNNRKLNYNSSSSSDHDNFIYSSIQTHYKHSMIIHHDLRVHHNFMVILMK